MSSEQRNPSDLYKNLIIEIRPLLQSVNVFVHLRRALKSVQICLGNDSIVINDESISYMLPCKKLDILPASLSCVQVTAESISFRFTTNNCNKLGTFKSEVLLLRDEDSSATRATFLSNNCNYNISCVNCSQVFCKQIRFNRVLSLPSDHSESGDWFCHSHSSSNNSNLDPKFGDLFYSVCFAHINSDLFSGVIKTSTNFICRRCMSWLGVIVNENCCKVWFNTVCFEDDVRPHKTDALCDVYLMLKHIVRESFLNSARHILQCQVSSGQTDYVLLWIIEKKLNVLTDSASGGLKDSFVAKVLFKFQSGRSDVVRQWMSSLVISSISISKPMMNELLKHLYEMNKMIPQDCSMSNDFYVSYLHMYCNE